MFIFIPVKNYITLFLYVTIFLPDTRLANAEANGQGEQPPEMLIVGNTLPVANYYQPVYTPAGYYTPLVKPIYHLPPSYVKPVEELQFTLTNLTTDVGGSLEVPFGERTTLAFSFPSMDDRSYSRDPKIVSFAEEPTTNIGSVITDTFVLKERGVIMNSHGVPATGPNAAILGGILRNVLTENKSKKPGNPQEEFHSPGELISMEIPLSGSPDYSGLSNLTEFLIEETSRVRPRKSHNRQQKAQAPMFVALQFHTVGRQKVRSYDDGAEKKVAIHVVLGHKHFEFKNVHQLNRLYEYVKPDYYIYKPTYGVPDYYVPVQNVLVVEEPKFYISKATVDLIIEFVEYTWSIHKSAYDETKSRGKFITERLSALIERNRNLKKKAEETRFRPERPWQEPVVDFFTWPYANTLAFRTLAL